MKKILLPSMLVLALAACSSTPAEKPAAVETKPATTDTKAAEAPKSDSKAIDPLAALKDPNNILSRRSVYFEFDKYDIQQAYQSLVEAHGKFLVTQPQLKVLVQGNTDDRGPREYNLALGQKRAEAVKKGMILMGAKETQVEAVSLGEEKPKSTGNNDSAWAENRRSDILYTGEY